MSSLAIKKCSPLTSLAADIYRLSPSRTLLKAQNLYMELMQLSSSFPYLRDSWRQVTASYMKHIFDPITVAQWRLSAIKRLRQRVHEMKYEATEDSNERKAILGCTVLLLQYAVRSIF